MREKGVHVTSLIEGFGGKAVDGSSCLLFSGFRTLCLLCFALLCFSQ